mmetsp:Transcript_162331/g.296302  ORF Transcript_162331/g.296302 Transcript_162331/m.296302 type:complete len:81 (-) Transcript_162331:152-394(-)
MTAGGCMKVHQDALRVRGYDGGQGLLGQWPHRGRSGSEDANLPEDGCMREAQQKADLDDRHDSNDPTLSESPHSCREFGV